MTYRVLTEATSAPVSVTDFKAHAFLYGTDEDTYLEEILLAAQEDVVSYIGEFVSGTSVRYDLADWSNLRLPHKRVISVTSVAYYDSDNELTTLAASNYIVDDNTNYVTLKLTVDEPTLSTDYSRPIQITYMAGFSIVPPDILQAIRIRAGEYYQSRSETTSSNVQPLPVAVERLLRNKRSYY